MAPVELRQGQSTTSHSRSSRWHFFGKILPRSEIVFAIQVVLVYIVVIDPIVNLSIFAENEKPLDHIVVQCYWLRPTFTQSEADWQVIMNDFYLTIAK